MGFTAVWITPIVDNPDEAFTGGDAVNWGGFFTDRGKTGYHGYWGVNFYELDEHLPSPGLDFAGLTQGLHGAGPEDGARHRRQPRLAGVHDAEGPAGVRQGLRRATASCVADHQNLPPEKLDPAHNPLHAFYNTRPDAGAAVATSTTTIRRVLDYLVGAYLQWIEQGADAFRIDTIRVDAARVLASVRRTASARKHPGFFMFGEAFDYDAGKIAAHTLARERRRQRARLPAEGGAWTRCSGARARGFETHAAARCTWRTARTANPYDLMTFYDNHDMARMDASDEGFIDAHNWLFTARGIPVVYYGSEIGFSAAAPSMPATATTSAQERIDAGAQAARSTRAAHAHRARCAPPRRHCSAACRSTCECRATRAAFYRVLQHDGVHADRAGAAEQGRHAGRVRRRRHSCSPGAGAPRSRGGEVEVGRGGTLQATVAGAWRRRCTCSMRRSRSRRCATRWTAPWPATRPRD